MLSMPGHTPTNVRNFSCWNKRHLQEMVCWLPVFHVVEFEWIPNGQRCTDSNQPAFFLSLPFNLPAYANTTNPPHLPAEASPTSVPTGGSWEAADSSTNTSAILFCSNLIHEVQRTEGFYKALKNLIQISDLCGVTEVAELPPAHPRYVDLY